MKQCPLNLDRLWRDTRIAPESDARGYMGMFTDPDSRAHFGFYPIDALAKHNCLFLIGRPGAGKSVEIDRIVRGEATGFCEEHLVVLRCKEVGEDLHLEIHRDPKWIGRQQQAKPVRLIIDGLDEGFLRDGAFFDRLKRTLAILQSEHPGLRLLATCRPAELDTTFVKSVHEAWNGGTGEPTVFALERLSHDNQRALVKHWNGGDPEEFFRWVRHNQFDEFTAWPRSLEWLAEQFRVGGGEGLNYTELCRLRVLRNFGEDNRLTKANRAARTNLWSHAIMLIAATLVFCARKGIALDGSEPDCLALDEMFCNIDRLGIPSSPPLTREDVREAVQTSHLIEAHQSYYRFENQSDLEFLASAMLASLDVEQLAELLGCPDHEGNWRVFPQLATTSANLAAQSPQFFNHMLTLDPRVLMRMDFASKSPDDCCAAVEAILSATAKKGATGGHEQHAHFSTLRHANITPQIRPWIFDKKQSPIVRELAFDIARECCDRDLWMEFARSAAAGDEFATRWLPAVIRRFGTCWPEKRLRGWAGSSEDELAGAALDALLDRGWKLRDLAPFLHEPTSDAFGLYHLHLGRLQRECTGEDVPAALAVISQWPGIAAAHGPVRNLMFALVAKGVSSLSSVGIRKALTAFLISRFEEEDWLLEEEGQKCGLDEATNRRSLLLALAEDWPTDSRAELRPFCYRLQREDYAWLLDAVAKTPGSAATILAKFAANLVWQFDESLRGPLEHAYGKSPELRAQLPATDASGIFATLQRLRAESEAKHQLRLEGIQAKRQRSSYNHADHLTASIARCRAGDPSAWTDVCFALTHSKSMNDGREFFRNTDPRQLAGWTEASNELRAEMTEIARKFLLRAEIPIPKANSIPQAFFGIAYALALHAARLGEDDELRSAIRPVWPLALLRHCGSEDGPLAVPLAALTDTAPSVVAAACRHEFQERWDRNESIFGQLFPAAWCAETEGVLVEVLSTVPLQPETYMSGLAMLAGHNSDLASQLATQRLAEYTVPPDDSAAHRAAIAACLFVMHDLWEKAWPHLLTNRKSSRQLLLEYSGWLDYNERDQCIAKMPVELSAALYELMFDLFPSSEAPHHESSYTPGSLDHAYDLRGHLKRSLEARGRHRELTDIYKRCEETQAAWWTPTSIDRAQNIAHASRREPPTATQFLRFLATKGGTFVSDNDSLQCAVLASLRRFERNLRPDGLLAIWEKPIGKKGKPRSEEVLQVEIARHLRREFEEQRIVVNMETKVLRNRTDIRVEAKPHVVTIEVKLGHSSDRDRPLRTAMRSQLCSYLKEQHETHGIYVVGWFFCPTFRPGALREMKTLSAARRYFDTQARKLSNSEFVLAVSVIDCSWPETATSRVRRRKS